MHEHTEMLKKSMNNKMQRSFNNFATTSIFFSQVGCFDPYSDDPRLGIQKIHLCKYSGYLTVAGTAGQVTTFLS